MKYVLPVLLILSCTFGQTSEIFITAPKDGAEFERDEDVEVEWTYININGKVIIEYSTDQSIWLDIYNVDVTDKNYFFELPFEDKSRLNSDGSVYIRIKQGLTKDIVRIVVPKIASQGGSLGPYQIPSDDEDIAEDLTLDELDFDDFSDLETPPPPPSGPKVVFIPYDDPPVAISPIRPVYPETAQEAGIEGVVVVQAFIDAKGRVTETLILKGVPNTGLNEAAMEAIRKTRFRPAIQRERAVGVWISIPVNFRLK